MTIDAKSLYQELLLQHGKHPKNEGPFPEATFHPTAHNPLCGDRVTMHVGVDEGGRLRVRFEGRGCLISRASASLLTELANGRTWSEVLALAEKLDALLGPAQPPEDLGPLSVWLGARAFPARRACVTLAWQALRSCAPGDIDEARR